MIRRRDSSFPCLGTCLFTAALAAAAGCGREDAPVVVVYTSIDQPFAAEMLARFERDTGVRVRAQYDTEAGKTTGLVRRVFRESGRPRCDVWWSSEVFGTLELARADLLSPYHSPSAADIPPEWKDPEGRWTGVAARARVLAYDPRRVPRDRLPATWRELARPEWARRLAIANPLFGTTRGHLAVLFATWGEAEGRSFLERLRAGGVRVTDGNSLAVQAVLQGAADACATDTDDVWVAQARGAAIELTYLSIDHDGPPLWIPCTVALLRGAPHDAAGRRLVDFLVSGEAEQRLSASDSRNVPVRSRLRAPQSPAPVAIDYRRAADSLGAADAAAAEILFR